MWHRVFEVVQNQQFKSTAECQTPGRTSTSECICAKKICIFKDCYQHGCWLTACLAKSNMFSSYWGSLFHRVFGLLVSFPSQIHHGEVAIRYLMYQQLWFPEAGSTDKLFRDTEQHFQTGAEREEWRLFVLFCHFCLDGKILKIEKLGWKISWLLKSHLESLKDCIHTHTSISIISKSLFFFPDNIYWWFLMFQSRPSLYIFLIMAFNPECKHIFHHSAVAIDPNWLFA